LLFEGSCRLSLQVDETDAANIQLRSATGRRPSRTQQRHKGPNSLEWFGTEFVFNPFISIDILWWLLLIMECSYCLWLWSWHWSFVNVCLWV